MFSIFLLLYSVLSISNKQMFLRWFLSFALRIPTAHDIRVISACTWACARTKRVVRDLPQSKLDSEKNAPFLLNKHGDLYFYYIKILYILSSLFSNKNKKNCRKEKKI